MTCVKPVKLRNKSAGNTTLTVCCGRCVLCRIAKAAEWATRILHERPYHDKAVFLTLTYACPDPILDKKELQNFFKRLRKYYTPVKYLACGEYGEKMGRAHYHAIVFGVGRSDEEKKVIEKCWPYGFCYYGNVSYNSARYVANYVLKGLKSIPPAGNKPFILRSLGIGARYVDDNKESLIKTPEITISGVPKKLPRYYVNRLKIEMGKRKDVLKHLCEKYDKTVETHKKRGCQTDEAIVDSVKRSRRQSEKNARARAALYQSKKGM